MAKKIMGWSKCSIEVGKTKSGDTMADSLTDIGVIKDKSSTLEPSDGETLEIKATGGETVAKETQEGGLLLKTRVIEPDDTFFDLFGLGKTGSEGYEVNTHIVSDNFSVKVTPKNVGAVGIIAPKTNVAIKPGWSEEEGHYADVEFEILKTDTVWYKRFKKAASSSVGS